MASLRSIGGRALRALARTRAMGFLTRWSSDQLMERAIEVRHGDVALRFAAPNELNEWRAKTFASKEPETLEWIDAIPDGAVLWDVGANVGLYSCYAALRRRCRVYAFEPSVFNLELLARNVWLNGLAARVTLVPLALTDALAESSLNMSSTLWGGAMSTFGRTYTHDGAEIAKTFEFRTLGLSMDEAVSRLAIPPPDYIKMDVDGIEHLILQGGPGVLSRARSVLVEINENFELQTNESRRLLAEAGLTFREKRHSDMFAGTQYENCYNQIWVRS
jgi:FkbM family methyltransferase